MRSWQADWIRDLMCPLPADLEKLRQEALENSKNTEPVRNQGMVRGQPTPFTAKEILSTSPESFADFLAVWSPGEEFGQPNRAGLGDALRQAVADDPAKLSDHLRALVGGEPAYVRSAIDGLSYAISTGKKADVSVVLDLASYAITRVVDEEPRKDQAWDQDPGWSWTATSVGILIVSLLAKEESLPLDIAHRRRIWSVIELMQTAYADADSTDESDDEGAQAGSHRWSMRGHRESKRQSVMGCGYAAKCRT